MQSMTVIYTIGILVALIGIFILRKDISRLEKK